MLRKTVKKLLMNARRNTYQPLVKVRLDKARMLGNIARVQSAFPTHEVIPVLKGNAYGHGMEAVATILRSSSCKYLAVDGYFEASRIRDICRQRIIVMGYVLPSNVRLVDTKRCSFVVQDIAGLRAFGSLGKPVRTHIELNTGMNRLGLQRDDLRQYLDVLREYPLLQVEGLMTHLADADNAIDVTYTNLQTETYDEMVGMVLADGHRPSLFHIAQTAGLSKVHSAYANAIRMGIGTYGINPLGCGDAGYDTLKSLQPVLELSATLIKDFWVQKGAKISYNGTYIAPRDMRIGVLPLGYYEGVPRDVSNKGCVLCNGEALSIVGTVCMNHTLVDLGTSDATTGDELVVISRQNEDPNSINTMQMRHGLFAYSTLTNLSSTIRREIV